MQAPASSSTAVRLVRYDESYREQWDDFVDSSNNGTIFHSRRFLEYHSADRFADHSLLGFKGGNLMTVLPAATVSQQGRPSLCSHPGASFGGFVLPIGIRLRDLESMMNAVKEYGLQQKLAVLDLKFVPMIYSSKPEQELEFLLHTDECEASHELTHVIDLRRSQGNWQPSYSASFGRNVRKARKQGVTVVESDDIEGFYRILRVQLEARHRAAPTHTLAELIDLRQRLPGQVRLFAAYERERMIAGMLIFLCNANALLSFYIAHRDDSQHLRPLNLLTDEICRWGLQQGFRFFDFGTSTLSGRPNHGLVRFREDAGAQGFLRTRLKLQF